MQTAIHVGSIVSKESLEPLTDAIVRIMSTPADQKTIRAALALIGRHADISSPVHLSNCSIVGDTTHEHYEPLTDQQDEK